MIESDGLLRELCFSAFSRVGDGGVEGGGEVKEHLGSALAFSDIIETGRSEAHRKLLLLLFLV